VTITAAEAYEAMRAHHRTLSEGLAGRADAISGAAEAGLPHRAAVAALIAYLVSEVLPHAAAEEETIYPVAAARVPLTDLISDMIAEHARLSAAAARLATLTDAREAVEQAQQIASLFAAHAAKENDIVLPVLLADQSVDLVGVLDQMHHYGEAGRADASAASHTDAAQTVDNHAEMVSLLPQAAAPVLAGPDLDVRDLPPAERHLRIFDTYHALLPGTGFVLVNDHDPKPLRYQFEAQYSGEHTWDYVEAGPRLWRVRIGRPAA
jgi:uncharacterized protein (DUF2249 family)/iron-sulfur cluster repair protein YtfE (RIC family)